ncbi:MAG: sigma-70 family RNA polymerase sigma factor [Bryobacteraceae bacterium]
MPKITYTFSLLRQFYLMERMKTLALVATVGPIYGPEDRCGPRGRPLEAAKAGDLAAFELLMRQYERLVLVTALRLLGVLEDAQDASQEVFLRLYRNLSRMEASSNFPGWLYQVTVNVCHDMHRKRCVPAPMEEVAELPALTADPQRTVVEAERRRALEMSLRMLSEKERAALVLRDLEGLSTEEVARVLGTTEATVRSQTSKARVKVRDFLERYFRRRT